MRLAAALLSALLLVTARARADELPENMKRVPLDVFIDGAISDPIVLFGCGDVTAGRHQLAITKAGASTRCHQKMGIGVYLVSEAERATLDALQKKDLGWGAEGVEAKKLLDKLTPCGTVSERTLIESSKSISALTVHFTIDKTATGCSLKKVGEVAPSTLSPPPATTSAQAPPPATSTPPASSPPKTSGCQASPTGDTSVAGVMLALVTVLARSRSAARRRSRVKRCRERVAE